MPVNTIQTLSVASVFSTGISFRRFAGSSLHLYTNRGGLSAMRLLFS